MPSKKLLKISYSVITTITNTNFELAKLTIAIQSENIFISLSICSIGCLNKSIGKEKQDSLYPQMVQLLLG